MKQYLGILLLCLGLVQGVFAASSTERYAYKTVSDFMANPKMFFLDIQYNIEDVTPVWQKNTAIQTNLFMDLCSIGNLNFKTTLLSQKEGVPQITAGLGGWYFWGLKLLKELDELKNAGSMNVYGFVPFVTLSYNVSQDLDLFAGTKLSVGHVEMDFRQVVAEEVSDQTLKDMVKNNAYLHQTYIDPALYVGMGIKTGEKSKITAQVGYQFIDQRVFGKINFAGEYWDIGIGFYPDSVFVVQPIINFSIKFYL